MASFFPDECLPLEAQLQEHFHAIDQSTPLALRNSIHALILGGSYGRGEGGIASDAEGSLHLYNDLDYFLFTDRPDDPAIRNWIGTIEKEQSALLGIDVEISPLTLTTFEKALTRHEMMAIDLAAGHRVVIGREDFLHSYHAHLDTAHIPLSEASRLLWNRGSGLYYARCELLADGELPFAVRNHRKALLALGDALLCQHGLYHSSLLERKKRLAQLPASDNDTSWRNHYPQAVAWKLHPDPVSSSRSELLEENAQLTHWWTHTFLSIESQRLGQSFTNLQGYRHFSGKIFPEIPTWKAPLYALRDWKKKRAFLRPIWDYPRGALFRALSYLLDEQTKGGVEEIQHYLPTPSPPPLSLEQWREPYTTWWAQYS